MQLLTALTNAGKDVSLRIFPPGAHGAVYNEASRVLLYRIYTQYLNLYLKGNCTDLNLNQ
jgi:dipeptidyl-peptidase-4